jgi:hypothetical protein
MNFKNILFFLCSALVVVSFEVYAVDASICNPNVKIELYNNGSLKSCDLRDDYKANEIPCNKGRVNFYDNGILESCMLSKPTTIGENKCDQLGLIYFYPDGKLKSCMKPGY